MPMLILMEEENLKDEVLHMKKEIHLVNSENYLLKTKLRKLKEELNRKNRQIENLLDPKKSASIKKIVSERGAAMILNLKRRNDELEKILYNKDIVLRKLQSEVQTIHLYKDSASSRFIPYLEEDEDLYSVEMMQLNQNLDRIKALHCRVEGRSMCDKNEMVFLEDAPLSMNSQDDNPVNWLNVFEDLQRMQTYFMDLLTEISSLKDAVSYLSSDQEELKALLYRKEKHIEALLKQRRKPRRKKIVYKFIPSVDNKAILDNSAVRENLEIDQRAVQNYKHADGDHIHVVPNETSIKVLGKEEDTTDDDADVETESDRR